MSTNAPTAKVDVSEPVEKPWLDIEVFVPVQNWKKSINLLTADEQDIPFQRICAKLAEYKLDEEYKFQVVQELGRGANGVVSKCNLITGTGDIDEKVVAVKELQIINKHGEFNEKIIREIQVNQVEDKNGEQFFRYSARCEKVSCVSSYNL